MASRGAGSCHVRGPENVETLLLPPECSLTQIVASETIGAYGCCSERNRLVAETDRGLPCVVFPFDPCVRVGFSYYALRPLRRLGRRPALLEPPLRRMSRP